MRSTVLFSLAVCLLGADPGAASVCRPPNSDSVSALTTSSVSSASSSIESIASSVTTSSTGGLATSTASTSVATTTASTETTTSASSTDESSTSAEITSILSITSVTADTSTTASISTSTISSSIPSGSTTTSAATSSTSDGPEPIATFNIAAKVSGLDGELLSAYKETSGYAIFKPNPQLPYHRTVQFSIEPDTGYLRTDKGQYACVEYYSDSSPSPITYCDAEGGTLAYLECERPVQGQQLICSVPAPACVLEYDGEDYYQVCTRGSSGEKWNMFYTTLGGPGYYVYIGVGGGNGYTPMEWKVEEV